MKVELRRITENDMDMVRKWRMLPDVTRFMYTDPIITTEQQLQWFRRSQESDDLNWIIFQDDNPVGLASLVKWDKQNRRITGGAYIAVKNRDSFKLSVQIQYNLLRYAFEKLQVNKVCGEVLRENVGMLKVLELCGSVQEGVLRQHVYKNGEYHDVIIQSTIYEDWIKIKDKAYQHICEIE